MSIETVEEVSFPGIFASSCFTAHALCDLASCIYQLQKMKGAAEFTHSCLEVLEVTGYCAILEVCEMIEGVLSIAATSLEKLVIKYDDKETMWRSVHWGKRQDVLRRIESRLPANCRLMLN